MKKYGVILGLVALFCCPLISFAVERTTVTKDSAGTMSHVSAYVTEAGQTVWQIMSDGSVSMYATTFNSLSSVTAVGKRGEVAVFNATGSGVSSVMEISGASIVNSSMPPGKLNAAVTTGVSSIGQEITGNIYYVDLTKSETLSGNTLYGGYVGNWGSTTGVTATLPSAKKGMNILFMLTQGQESGKSIFVVFNAADTLIGVTGNWSSANSAVQLSGTTMLHFLAANSWRDGYWYITGSSGVAYRNK